MKLILWLFWVNLIGSLSYAIDKPGSGQRSAQSILALENIPLMKGLKLTGEIEDVGRGGNSYRIEAEASGNLFVEDIEEFYQDALQAYSWERTGRFSYVLCDKYLEIIPQNQAGMLTVIFQIKSKTL